MSVSGCVSLCEKCCARMQNYSRLGNHLIGFHTCCFGWCSRAAENTAHHTDRGLLFHYLYRHSVLTHQHKETRTRALRTQSDANWIGNWKVWPHVFNALERVVEKSTSHPVNIGVCVWAEFVRKFTWNIYCMGKCINRPLWTARAAPLHPAARTWINFERASGFGVSPAQREIKSHEFIF